MVFVCLLGIACAFSVSKNGKGGCGEGGMGEKLKLGREGEEWDRKAAGGVNLAMMAHAGSSPLFLQPPCTLSLLRLALEKQNRRLTPE